MPTTYLMDPVCTLSYPADTPTTTVNITDQVSAIEINLEANVLGRTTFGNTWERNGRGLKKGTIKYEFYVDFSNNGIFELFNTLWNSHERVAFNASEPGGAAAVGVFVMSAMPTFAGKVGEYNVASLTFTLDGVCTITERV